MYCFIVNPKSGCSVDTTAVRQLRDHCRQRGKDVRLTLTQSLEHAGQLAAEAVRVGAEGVVVAGGDGTVRAVAEAMAGSTLPILIIPWGTENLLACELGLDGSVATNVRTLERGLARPLDLGRANGRCFMAVLGVGFDAEVVRRVHSQRSGHISPASYVWPLLRTFWEHRFPHLRVEADGEVVCDEPALVFVSNIARYAIGLGISRGAESGDGLLDLCIYKCDKRLRLVSHSVRTVLGTSERDPRVTRRKCRKVAIDSVSSNVCVQLDGDPGPALPLKVEVVPTAATVLTPPVPGGDGDGDPGGDGGGQGRYSRPVRFYHLRRWILR